MHRISSISPPLTENNAKFTPLKCCASAKSKTLSILSHATTVGKYGIQHIRSHLSSGKTAGIN